MVVVALVRSTEMCPYMQLPSSPSTAARSVRFDKAPLVPDQTVQALSILSLKVYIGTID